MSNRVNGGSLTRSGAKENGKKSREGLVRACFGHESSLSGKASLPVNPPLISLADLASGSLVNEILTNQTGQRIRAFGPNGSGFNSRQPTGTEWRFFRRISDKDACRSLPFWPIRKIH
jgi:hypothetical protein